MRSGRLHAAARELLAAYASWDAGVDSGRADRLDAALEALTEAVIEEEPPPHDPSVDVLIVLVDDETIALHFSALVDDVKMSAREARILGMQLRAAADELERT
jgi:hypothetical protein